MEQTWKPVTSGVLSIIAGAVTAASGLIVLLMGCLITGLLSAFALPVPLSLVPLPVLGLFAMPLFILGTAAIVGGACALRRRAWPMALTGAICALFAPQLGLLGVIATVFVILGRGEFT
ncbi:MAG: hypothetical protein GX600_08410 [Dehalococcoidia bacterium]|jgi:hypothetical protein|nr:hypothetical protein [Dehalococcoidia bacterium]